MKLILETAVNLEKFDVGSLPIEPDFKETINYNYIVPTNLEKDEPRVNHRCECYFFIGESDSSETLNVAMLINSVSYVYDNGLLTPERKFYEKEDIDYDFIYFFVRHKHSYILSQVQQHIFENTGTYTYIDEV